MSGLLPGAAKRRPNPGTNSRPGSYPGTHYLGGLATQTWRGSKRAHCGEPSQPALLEQRVGGDPDQLNPRRLGTLQKARFGRTQSQPVRPSYSGPRRPRPGARTRRRLSADGQRQTTDRPSQQRKTGPSAASAFFPLDDQCRVSLPESKRVMGRLCLFSDSLFLNWRRRQTKPKHKTTTDCFTAMNAGHHR